MIFATLLWVALTGHAVHAAPQAQPSGAASPDLPPSAAEKSEGLIGPMPLDPMPFGPARPEPLPFVTSAPAPPPDFSWSGLSTANFLADRRALLQALAAATEDDVPPGADAIRSLLDLATFYMGHAMAAEGRSILSGLDTVALGVEDAARRNALALGLGLLDDAGTELSPMAQLLLQPAYAGWTDQPLFLALAQIRTGDMDSAAKALPAATERLATFPKPFREAVLPVMLEAAIEGGEWAAARLLAGQFRSHGALKDSEAYHYLLGRAAMLGEGWLAAFDSFARASEGSDLWAHKARMALLNMGEQTDSLAPEDRRDILRQARQLWRGDAYAVDVLMRLARAEEALDNPVGAIEAYGQLLTVHPDEAAAAGLQDRALALIAAYYDQGVAGTLPLTEFLIGHRRIARDYWFDTGFPAQAERFARRFEEVGATDTAAREFGTIHDYLVAAQELGLAQVDPARLDRLQLDRAAALLAGGQYDEAGIVLAAELRSDAADLRSRSELLKARFFTATGETAQLLQMRAVQGPGGYLRLKAQAEYDGGNWAEARASYDQLWRAEGDDFPFVDAIRLLLAAYRAGDRALALELAEGFPKLTDMPQWREIATALLRRAPETGPLTETAAKARLQDATQTLDAIEAVTAAGN